MMLPQNISDGLGGIAIMLFSAFSIIIVAGLLSRPALKSETQAFVVAAHQLKPIIGHTVLAGDFLKLDALQNGMAVISSGSVRLRASAFPYLSISQTGLTQDLNVDLFWRTEGQEKTVHTERLYVYGDGLITLHLAVNPLWKGDIVEFGLSVEGDLSQPFSVESIRFESWSIVSWAASIWDQWWSYGGWKGTSVNFISGGRYDKIQNIPAPEQPMLFFVVVWLGLSLCLYLLACRIPLFKLDWHVPLTMFLLGWLLLDSRWLYELWLRTEFTQDQYSGKTQQQKWQNEKDHQWYMMVDQLKQHIPEQSARIFQVYKTRQPLDDYFRFRVRYHLLPHNIYPYLQALPKPSEIKRGDYILDLGKNTELTYNSDSHHLVDVSSNLPSLHPMILKYKSRLGRLYQFQGG